jgi:hypothetical protein
MNTAAGLLITHTDADNSSVRTTKLDAKFRDEVRREAEEF